jgi:hypothetical protein
MVKQRHEPGPPMTLANILTLGAHTFSLNETFLAHDRI